jgi:hypothetical protein
MSKADSPQRVVGQIHTFRCLSQRQPTGHLNISSLASPLDNRLGRSASPKRQCTSESGQEENYWLASHTTRWSEFYLRYNTIRRNMLRRTVLGASSCRRLFSIQWVYNAGSSVPRRFESTSLYRKHSSSQTPNITKAAKRRVVRGEDLPHIAHREAGRANFFLRADAPKYTQSKRDVAAIKRMSRPETLEWRGLVCSMRQALGGDLLASTFLVTDHSATTNGSRDPDESQGCHPVSRVRIRPPKGVGSRTSSYIIHLDLC